PARRVASNQNHRKRETADAKTEIGAPSFTPLARGGSTAHCRDSPSWGKPAPARNDREPPGNAWPLTFARSAKTITQPPFTLSCPDLPPMSHRVPVLSDASRFLSASACG